MIRTYLLVFHTYFPYGCLQIRDFYLWTALREGDKITRASGIRGGDNGDSGSTIQWRYDQEILRRWASGETGFPFVDACMKEIAATGWMSNRGRQNVASFLTLALKQDWRLGAELFESLLLDHDTAINLVNW